MSKESSLPEKSLEEVLLEADIAEVINTYQFRRVLFCPEDLVYGRRNYHYLEPIDAACDRSLVILAGSFDKSLLENVIEPTIEIWEGLASNSPNRGAVGNFISINDCGVPLIVFDASVDSRIWHLERGKQDWSLTSDKYSRLLREIISKVDWSKKHSAFALRIYRERLAFNNITKDFLEF